MWVRLLFFLLFPFYVLSQEPLSKDSVQTAQLLFAGDLMSHGPQLSSAYNDSLKTYSYTDNFKFIDSIIRSADLALVNLETTIGVKPYSGYPAFSAPPALVVAAKKAGFDFFVTANNHTCDKGKKGIIKTLDILDRLHLKHTGSFRNKKEKDSLYPLITDVNGIKIAWLNYTYGMNGISVPYPTKVNLIDKKKIAGDVAKAKALNPDIIIAFLHWGTQYQHKPDDSQKSLEKYLHGMGVRYIIGSHPHVIQPVVFQKDSLQGQFLTVYSMGNFLSNQRKFPRDGSILISVQIEKNKQKTYIRNLEIIPIWVYKYQENNKNKYEILPVEEFIYNPDYFKKNTDYQKMMRYYKHFSSFGFDRL